LGAFQRAAAAARGRLPAPGGGARPRAHRQAGKLGRTAGRCARCARAGRLRARVPRPEDPAVALRAARACGQETEGKSVRRIAARCAGRRVDLRNPTRTWTALMKTDLCSLSATELL